MSDRITPDKPRRVPRIVYSDSEYISPTTDPQLRALFDDIFLKRPYLTKDMLLPLLDGKGELCYVSTKITAPTPKEVLENLKFGMRLGAKLWSEAGLIPVVPHANNAFLDGNISWDLDWLHYMAIDTRLVRSCDSIYLAEGSDHSLGRRLEEYLARRWDKKIYIGGDPNSDPLLNASLRPAYFPPRVPLSSLVTELRKLF